MGWEVTALWAVWFPSNGTDGSMKMMMMMMIISISCWVECLLLLGCYPAFYVTLCTLHVSHAFQGSAKQTLLPFVSFSQGFWKISRPIPSFLSLKVSSVDVTMKFMTDGIEPPAYECWRKSFNLIEYCTKNVRLHPQNLVNEPVRKYIENTLIWTV